MRIPQYITRKLIAALCVLCALTTTPALPAGHSLAARQQQEKTEIKYFTATVIQGPDKGLSMTGKMELQIASDGSFTGSLVRTSGGPLKVSGQITKAAFNIVIMLSNGRAIFGSGSLVGDLTSGQGAAGGVFTGPSRLDLGTWGTCLGVYDTKEGKCYGLYFN